MSCSTIRVSPFSGTLSDSRNPATCALSHRDGGYPIHVAVAIPAVIGGAACGCPPGLPWSDVSDGGSPSGSARLIGSRCGDVRLVVAATFSSLPCCESKVNSGRRVSAVALPPAALGEVSYDIRYDRD